MALKDISEVTESPIGYLSRLERGLASIAHNTLEKAAKALGVEIAYLVEQPKTKEKTVLRSYEQEILYIEGGSVIKCAMTNMIDCGEVLPELAETLSQGEMEEPPPYPHEGEEFVYVLESILTLQIEDDVCDLHPGDCARYESMRTHNRSDQTNKIVKSITINTSNLPQEIGEKL